MEQVSSCNGRKLIVKTFFSQTCGHNFSRNSRRLLYLFAKSISASSGLQPILSFSSYQILHAAQLHQVNINNWCLIDQSRLVKSCLVAYIVTLCSMQSLPCSKKKFHVSSWEEFTYVNIHQAINKKILLSYECHRHNSLSCVTDTSVCHVA
jgi:hypothetical protein